MKLKMFFAYALLLVVISGCGSSADGPIEPLAPEVLEQVIQQDSMIADEESAL